MEHGDGALRVTEAELREAYRGVMARGRGGRAACPDPAAIQALVSREGSEEARLATLDHVMSCGDCRGELDLLRSLVEAGPRSEAAARPRRRKWFIPVALAASLLLAVGLGRLALRSDENNLRSGGGSRVQLVVPGANVAAGAPVDFAWHPVEGASRYRLEVLTEAGDLAIEAETHDTALTVGAVGRLAPGSYQWWVIALTPAPGPRSELRPLRLTPP